MGRFQESALEGQNPGGVEQQVTKDASESHPHRLPQKGWYGGDSRERAKKGVERRRGERRGEKRREKEKEPEQENTDVKATLHTLWSGNALSSACCFFQKEKRSGPHRCVPATENWGVCVSTHAATVSAHGLLAGAGV